MPASVSALLLILLGTGVHQLEGVMTRKYNEKNAQGGFLFTAMVSLFAMLFFVFSARDGLQFSLQLLPYGLAAGLCYCTASLLTFVALGCGSFVLSNLFLSYALLFSVGYGVFFLKEPVSLTTGAGIALSLLSIFLVRGEKQNDKAAGFSIKWLVCILLSCIGSGMLGVLQKMQQVRFCAAADNEFMVITLGFSALCLFAAGLAKNARMSGRTLLGSAPYAILAGLSNGAANLLNLIVNTMLPLSVAAPSRSGIKILFSLALARLLFHEKLSARQLAGILAGTASLILLNL
ncbi:MAG: EamA family transporter [Oscillospiraceae bacterium]|nr:EamA family transporter [Oscillospiraceae bacterium]